MHTGAIPHGVGGRGCRSCWSLGSLYFGFLYPIRTGTYGPLPDRLPARCPEKTGRLRRKLNFGTSTIDRAPRRSDRFQAINPERQPALLVCWVARLSIRQRASGASPCEVGAQAQESETLTYCRIVEEFDCIRSRRLQPYHRSGSLTSSGAAAPTLRLSAVQTTFLGSYPATQNPKKKPPTKASVGGFSVPGENLRIHPNPHRTRGFRPRL